MIQNIQLDMHIHSKYSPDSLLEPINIIKIAKMKGLDGVAITDHNTILGGSNTSELNKDENFLVIIGAEIKTDIGDIIGLFLKDEIKSKDFYSVVDEIKDQEGIVILPHPYRGHILNEKIIKSIDIVEVFNARMKNNALNQKARRLASKYNLPVTAGSDAHFASEIGNARVLLSVNSLNEHEVKKAMLKNKQKINGEILPLYKYVLYEFVIGKAIRFMKEYSQK